MFRALQLRDASKKNCPDPRAKRGVLFFGSHEMYRYRQYYVYILASRRNGTLYTGVTGNLARRVFEHKSDLIEGFTKRYSVHRLVWVEIHEDIYAAILREKRIKKWRRTWKLQLIEKTNPAWDDLYERFLR